MPEDRQLPIKGVTRPEHAAARPVVVDCLPEDMPMDISLKLLHSEAPRKMKQLQVKGANARVRLEGANGLGTGSETGASVSTASSFAYALVLLDESDKSIDIVAPCERISLKRKVIALEAVAPPPAKNAPAPAPVDYRTAQTALGEAFGTKKRRQAIHSFEKNAIDMTRLQASAGAFIGRTIDATIVSRLPTPEPSIASVSGEPIVVDNGLLPPYCQAADKASEIYPVKSLTVPEDVWMALPLIDDMDVWKTSLGAAEFILERVDLKPSPERDDRLFLLLYLHYIIALFRLKEAQVNSMPELRRALYGLSPELYPRLLHAFFDEIETAPGRKRYKQPQVKRDRLATFCCALALHLDPMRANATQLAAAMGLTGTKMAQYFRALGCAIETGGKKAAGRADKWAVLKAPLMFPKPSLKR